MTDDPRDDIRTFAAAFTDFRRTVFDRLAAGLRLVRIVEWLNRLLRKDDTK